MLVWVYSGPRAHRPSTTRDARGFRTGPNWPERQKREQQGRGARGDQTCLIDCAAINTNNIALHIEHDGHSVHLTDCA